MGEAKRRAKRLGQETPYFSIAEGITRTGKFAGDPLAFRRDCANGTSPATVPCTTCRECCWYKTVEVYPENERPENLAHLDLVQGSDSLILRKREDGACGHLGPNGCTVYAHRPAACRDYDCRIFSLIGSLDSFDNGHVSPMWVFQPTNAEGRAFVASLQIMGMAEMLRRRAAGQRWTSIELANAVLHDPNREKILSAMQTFAAATPEMQTELLGFDPRSISLDQLSEMARATGLTQEPPEKQETAE